MGYPGGGFGGSRGPVEMHPVKCAECGADTEVPFKPTQDRPVYCRECYQKQRGGGGGRGGYGGRGGGFRGGGRGGYGGRGGGFRGGGRGGYGGRGGGFRGGGGGFRGPPPEAAVRVGETYDVDITEVGNKGDGIARVENFVVFVPGAEKGEHVKVRIREVARRFAVAERAGEGSEEPAGEPAEEPAGEPPAEESGSGEEPEKESGEDEE